MNALTGSWKTSLAGLIAGAATIAMNAMTPGMTPKQWGIATAHALALALVGILAKDHVTPPAA